MLEREPREPAPDAGVARGVQRELEVTLDMTRGRTGPQVIRGPHTGDDERALESLDALAATGARTVLPGHGEPFVDGVVRAAVAARRAD